MKYRGCVVIGRQLVGMTIGRRGAWQAWERGHGVCSLCLVPHHQFPIQDDILLTNLQRDGQGGVEVKRMGGWDRSMLLFCFEVGGEENSALSCNHSVQALPLPCPFSFLLLPGPAPTYFMSEPSLAPDSALT